MWRYGCAHPKVFNAGRSGRPHHHLARLTRVRLEAQPVTDDAFPSRDVSLHQSAPVIACAESWDDIALYGRSKLDWLRTFLELPNGIPSHDTFRRVFMLIDPEAFEAGFAAWAGSLMASLEREVVAIDGKTIRRSFGRGREQSPLHVV